MKKFGCLIAAVVVVLIFGLYLVSVYNGLVGSEQAVEAQWAQVQNVYQRRADLIPNLVNTVSGAANFEKSTLTEVTEAPRTRIAPVVVPRISDVADSATPVPLSRKCCVANSWESDPPCPPSGARGKSRPSTVRTAPSGSSLMEVSWFTADTGLLRTGINTRPSCWLQSISKVLACAEA